MSAHGTTQGEIHAPRPQLEGTPRSNLDISARPLSPQARKPAPGDAGVWSNDEVALPGDPPGNLEIVDGPPEGGKIPELDGNYGAFAPDYAPQEIFEIASKLYKKSR